MIVRLRLHNWRAYRRLDIELGKGTTFVVARNGLGKSSLVEAARFAATGVIDRADTAIRAGTSSAAVEATLDVGGLEVEIRRSISLGSRGRPSVDTSATVSGKSVSDLESLLEREWRAPTGFIAHTAFLQEGLQSAEPIGIRDQLARAFGIEHLRSALSDLEVAFADTETRIVALDRDVRAADQRREDLVAASARVAEHVGELAKHADDLREQVATAEARARARAVRNDALTRHEDWRSQHLDLSAQLQALVDPYGGSADTKDLDALEAWLSREQDVRRSSIAEVRARIDSIASALESLGHGDALCPVCRRPLDEDSRRTATEEHERDADALRQELASQEGDPFLAESRSIHDLVRRIRSLGAEPAVPEVEEQGDAASEPIGDVREAWELAVGELAARRAEHQQAIEELRIFDAEASRVEQVRSGYRELSLIDAARGTANRTIERVLTELVDPTLAVVRRRWKHLFPDRPDLQLDLDGNITRFVSGVELPYDAFSAGERAAAQLLLRLVLVDATTKAKFCWVDEPLEHLDPQSRRLVGGILASGTRTSDGEDSRGLNQILVTTYEEALARRLADAVEDARLVYVSVESAE